jgi:hypothetical protein
MVYSAKFASAGLFIVLQAEIVVSTRPSFLPQNFAFWYWQSCNDHSGLVKLFILTLLLAIVVGNWLYIDGGQISATGYPGPSTYVLSLLQDANVNTQTDHQTISIDLQADWNTSTLDPTAYVVTNKSTAISPMRQPDLFYDPQKEVLYSLGGWPYPNRDIDSDPQEWTNSSQQVQLWGFQPNDNTGAVNGVLQAVGSTANFPLNEVVAGALTATSSSNHYSLGGYSNSDGAGLNQLISYNFTNQSWVNQTLTRSENYYLGTRTVCCCLWSRGHSCVLWGYMAHKR